MVKTKETELLPEPRHYEILSTASIAEVRTHVLKHGDLFAVFDPRGDVVPTGNMEQGLYNKGTRHLSRMQLSLGKYRPVLLNSAVRKDNTLLTVNLTNPGFPDREGHIIPHGTVHVFREKVLAAGSCFEHVRVRNFGTDPMRLTLSFVFDADFVDIFEVRGTRRARRGTRLPPEVGQSSVVLSYRGLDHILRRTMLAFSPEPEMVSASEVQYTIELGSHDQYDLFVTINCTEETPAVSLNFGEVLKTQLERERALKDEACRITTSNEQFNAWLERSLADLHLLLTKVPDGYYPYAGIPWYNTFFGRDGILTALMTCWINPRIARGVLGYLARTQADEINPERAATPGKILHEAREGEMAALGEIPFGKYYGTVDATPLFALLAGVYYDHTGDREFIESIWPNIERALEWIASYGDVDGDGFVEYQAHEDGLVQQGWKDSEDSIFHADGRLAEGPIALCEVQGYVYAAKLAVARLADMLGRRRMAQSLWQEASRLKTRFREAFWCEDLGTYALALDGDKRPCRVRTSNAGHTLFSRIASDKHAARMVEGFFSPSLYSGWGIRTLSSREQRYNPMSYHNGSVWPHDNAIVGLGLARYGYKRHVHRLLKAFFDASLYDPQQRLPELFCGFKRRPDEGPTPYPVACSPQAWASAAVFCLLQACFDLYVEAPQKRLVLRNPSLPKFLEEIRLENLKVGTATVDLVLQRHARSVGVELAKRKGEVEVIAVK